jgi:hypothetical protein
MIGTMAATFNTELLSTYFTGSNPMKVSMAAAVIGGLVYLIALVASFWLPKPHQEAPAADKPTTTSLSAADEGTGGARDDRRGVGQRE